VCYDRVVKRGEIEPGLMPIFRAFVGLQLVLLLVLTFSGLVPARLRISLLGLRTRLGVLRPAAEGVQAPTVLLLLLGLLALALLLAYLSAPALGRRLTWAYLPLALIFHVAFLIVGYHLFSVRLAATSGTSGLVLRSWQLFLLLFVPLILTAWQYSFGIVVLFCAAVGCLDLLLTLPLLRTGASGAGLYSLLLVFRTAAFLLVGYLITRVLQIQRGLRHELAEANARLVRYAADLEELATSRERNRLARELHDTLAHALSGLAVQLEAAVTQWESHPTEARRRIEASLVAARAGLTEARRAIKNLRASALDERGLRGALQSMAEGVAGKAGITLDLQLPPADPRLSSSVEQGIYRIAEEALLNAVQHADPKRLTVHMTQQAGEVELVVEDDGRGAAPSAAGDDGHYGLQGMLERAELIGGRLEVGPAPGGGTRVRLRVKEEA
jgi:signal transduction histidine kinase